MNCAFSRQGAVGCLTAAILILHAALPVTAQDPSASQPSAAATLTSPWTPESFKALKAWRLGDRTQTRWAADEMARNARDARVRRDAAAITAMVLMDSDSRADCQDGRAKLDGIAREDPGVLGRPDCCLAYGLADRTLFETTSAISQFLAAERGYTNENAIDSLARTWVALADAWSVHNEWPAVIPSAPFPQPKTAEDARAYRRTRIEELLARATKLAAQFGAASDDPRGPRFIADAPAAIELSLCEALLANPETRAEALQRLEKLASGAATTRAWARAGLVLSRIRESDGDTAGAIALLDRIAHARLGEESDRASARLTALREPKLDISGDRQQAAGAPVTIHLRGAQVKQATVEIRRVDLAAHLAANQGRLAEIKLPIDGATQWAHEAAFDTAARDLEFSLDAPIGEYVICARGNGPQGTEVISKRLLIVSKIRATGWMGGDAAAIWSQRLDGAPLPAATVQFWLAGAYVPSRAELADGVAIVNSPSDPRLSRETQWLGLLQSAEGTAICFGSRARPGETPLPMALIAERDVVQVGKELRILGVLLDDTPINAEERIEIEVRDATDGLRARRTVGLSAGRTFTVAIPINEEMIGVQHVVARRGARTLDNAQGRLVFSVPSPEEADFDVLAGRARNWETLDHPFLRGEFSGIYPWGTALSEVTAQTRYHITELPTDDEPRETPRLPSSRLGKTDRTGRFSFIEALSDYGIKGQRPVAVATWCTMIGWDGRGREGFSETIFGPRPIHAWIEIEPDKPAAGQDVRLRLAWFDPLNKLASTPTSLRITGAPAVELPLSPGMDGLRSAPWRPLQSGPLEALAELKLADGSNLEVRRHFEVSPATASRPAMPEARLQAMLDGEDQGRRVHVRMSPAPQGPLLILLTDLRPIRAQIVDSHSAELDASVAIPDEFTRGTASVWSWQSDRPQLVAQTSVQPDAERLVDLQAEVRPGKLEPGSSVEVLVRSARPRSSGLTVIGRLIPAGDQGGVGWRSGQSREITVAEYGPEFATPDSGGDESQIARGREVEMRPDMLRALFEGRSVWADSRALLNGRARFQVNIPDRPGEYRMLLSVWGVEGLLGTRVIQMDAAAPLEVNLEAPNRMMVGDRTVAGCMIRNGESSPIRVRAKAAGSKGVSVDDLVLITGAKEISSDAEGLLLEIPTQTTAIIRARIEGNAPGAGNVGIRLQCGETEVHRTADIQVDAIENAESSADSVRVRREIFVLTPAPKFGARPAIGVAGETPGDWVRTPVAADERVPTGSRLLVVDEFDLGDSVHGVRWQQRLPLNARTEVRRTNIVRAAGRLVSGGATELVYTADGQKGRMIHEYLMVAVRPGACRFPAPALDLDGRRTAVKLETAATNLLVDDGTP